MKTEEQTEHNSKADPWDLRNTKALTGAIYAVVSKLAARGYLHEPKDVEFVRPGYKSVLPCARMGPHGVLIYITFSTAPNTENSGSSGMKAPTSHSNFTRGLYAVR